MVVPGPRSATLLVVGIAAAAAVVLAFFWEFTADDAYIYMRYGEKLVETGALVFNDGERVSTMTSPFLALLDALLYALTGATRLSYKVLSVGLLAWTAVLVLRRLPSDPLLRALAAAVLLLPPSVVLWTAGGMEVPIHMLVATAATLLALDGGRDRPGRAAAVLFLAGLATVCRQDAAPYMVGLCLFALWGQRPVAIAWAVLAGAALPVAWSVFSLAYYEDLFPTSFYTKMPRADLPWLLTNGAYIGQFLLYTGAVPFALWVAAENRVRRGDRSAGAPDVRLPWGPWLGLVLQLGYGLTMATVHMMFAYRALVPYLPVLVLLVGESARRAALPARGPGASRALAGLVLAVVALQIAQNVTTYRTSIQGFSVTGELQRAPLPEFTGSMVVAERLIRDVEEHWLSLPHRPREHPRIWTWAEGIMPHAYPGAYFFGSLISYRHHGKADPSWADYVLRPVPPLTEVSGAISDQPLVFNGAPGRMVAIYNPNPSPNLLPPTVGGTMRE